MPGGSAPYPSSLVMTVVPAQVAGVGAVVVASPADRDGEVNPVLLGAAGLLGVDAFIVAGGAQAVGALAYGLPDEGVEPVDRIVGPGQRVGHRRQARGRRRGRHRPAGRTVGGDGPRRCDRRRRAVAADLITQAEHGPDSPALLVTDGRRVRRAVEAKSGAARDGAAARILERSLAEHGRVVLGADARCRDRLRQRVRPGAPVRGRGADSREPSRGSGTPAPCSSGRWAPESAGDYATGANHVLPTGGLARASGALAVESYGKFIQVQRITREGLAGIRDRPQDARRSRGPARPPRRRRGSLRGATLPRRRR